MIGMLDLERELAAILGDALRVDDASFGNVQKFNPGIPGLAIVAQFGFARPFLDAFRCVRLDDPSVCGRAFRENRRVFIADVTTDPLFFRYQAVAIRAGFRAVQSTPIRSRAGYAIGVLSTHFAKGCRPARGAGEELDRCAQRAGRVLEALGRLEG